uniref:Uncharacterized protein LOC104210106 n=1 Tax=Nicotiana sylvestris TaxID=4096 RepID=A0A1U7V663_NICSY|nr:PREDICTED: uncharacterized protein LOC104210106 [Nicotiana sylvestris]
MAEEQPMDVQEVAMPSIANVTSSIVKPRIPGHFELKQSMIQLLYPNGQFMGLPHEDPQQHILNFLEISDTYIINGVTPDYVRLTLFPFSLMGEAKRWLKAEPANSITSWNDLARNFWQGSFLQSNPDWQGEMGRHTVQKSAGVLELDVISALSAQISTLTNHVNQMKLSINKQQAQPVQQVQIFCDVCGEGHMSNLCPANPESVYFIGNANRGQTNQYGDTYNPNWRNHPNFS